MHSELKEPPMSDTNELVERLPATGPYVDRLIRIFRDRPADDTSAVVLQDYARAALAPLEAVPVACATEGCDNPATNQFIRGGVGSTYCDDCFAKVIEVCARLPAQAGAVAEAQGWPSKAASDVVAERRRQVEAEGWTPEHDNSHDKGEMAAAAGVYALIAGSDATTYRNARDGYGLNDYHQPIIDRLWPWDISWLKVTNRRRDLVKAGALIVAEIERLDRLTPPVNQSEGAD